MLSCQKVSQASSILRDLGLDAWLTFVRETSVTPDPILELILEKDVTWQSAFLVSASGRATAIVGSLDAASVKDSGAWPEVVPYVQSVQPPLLAWLDEVRPRTLAINWSDDSEIADGLTHGMFRKLSGYLAGTPHAASLVSAERVISALREQKTDEELRRMREAVAVTLRLYDDVARFLAPGQTEAEVASFLRRRMIDLAVEPAWAEEHCPSVFSGPDTAGAHYGPTERRIERGHIVNMDFGVKIEGYCSDLQRTFYVRREGETRAPAEVQRGFDVLLASIQRSFAAIRPGCTGREIDAVARDTITGAGYPEYPHALGHQVGRHAHDGAGLLAPPWERYGRRPDLPLQVGQVYTIEPRLPVPDHGVVTIEEEILVTDTGAEWLSTPQTELILVG